MYLKFASEYCAHAKFVLKTDDDMFVNIFNIVDMLRQKKNEPKSIIGKVVKGSVVIRNRKSKMYAYIFLHI